MKTLAIALLSLFVSQTQATNTVPDGSYAGSGSWSSSGPNGTYSGNINMEWAQNGENSENLGVLMMGGQVVQQFNDHYKFVLASGIHYTMSRLQNSTFVAVGACTQSSAGYSCSITQDTPNGSLAVQESGFMQNGTTLVRIGTMTAADGTVTTYSATLTKQ